MNNKRSYTIDDSYGALLLFLACASALLYTGDHIYHLAFFWLTLVLWMTFLVATRESVIFEFDTVTVFSLGYVFWLLATIFVHPSVEVWELYTYRLSVFPIALLVAYHLIKNTQVRQIFFVLMIVALIDSFVTLYQAFYLGISADGFFANRNNNAAYLCINLLPLLSMLVLTDIGLKMRAIYLALSAIFLLCVFQISSRGVYVSLFVSAGMLYVYAAYQKKYINLLIVSGFLAFLIIANSLISDVSFKSDVSSHSRWLLWISAIDMIKDSPWYGIGNGMFHWLYPQYLNSDEKSLGLFVHNDYLQMLLELGIVGVTLFVSMFIVPFLEVRRVVAEKLIDDEFPIYFGMALSVITILIHSLVTFDFYIVIILLVLGLYVGFILKYVRCRKASTGTKHVFHVTALSKFLVGITMILLVTPLLLKGYADGVLDDFINKDLANANIEEKYEIYSWLGIIDPTRYVYPMSVAWTGMVLSHKYEHNDRVDMFHKTMRMLSKAKKLNPYAPDVYLVEAQVLTGFNDIDKTNLDQNIYSSLNNALILNPRFKPARVMLAGRLESSGELKQALVIMNSGLPYLHGFGHKTYYERGATLAKKVGDNYSYTRFENLLEREKENNMREFKDMIEEYKRNTSKM